MNKNDSKMVKILWQDAISYKIGDTVPHFLSMLETTGLLAKEDDDFVVVEKPVTINTRTGKSYPGKAPTFYFIPRGMVESIEQV